MDNQLSIGQIGSYNAAVTAGVDLMPLIFDNASTVISEMTGIEIKLTQPYMLRHITIFGNDGDAYKINNFIFEIHNGSFSTAMFGWTDFIKVYSIVPMQDTSAQIYYVR